MTSVICTVARRGSICGQVLYKVGQDFSGTVEIKCPRCRSTVTKTWVGGECRVA